MNPNWIRTLIGTTGVVLIIVVAATHGISIELGLAAITAIAGLAGYEMVRGDR